MNQSTDLIKVADIHVERIQMALEYLQNIFPLSEHKINNLTKQELLMIELLTSRFAKLQALMGKKIIDMFLLSTGDLIDEDTMIDKINKLERLKIVKKTSLWKNMREIRNHIAHEYPEQPALTALYLNQLFEITPELLNILNKIKKHLNAS